MNRSVSPNEINDFLEERDTTGIEQKTKAVNIARRPQVFLRDLLKLLHLNETSVSEDFDMKEEIIENVEIRIKYEGYISREKLMAEKIGRLEGIRLDPNLDYHKMNSISTEGRQKLTRLRPGTIGQASRISGVSPSDISVLLVYMGR